MTQNVYEYDQHGFPVNHANRPGFHNGQSVTLLNPKNKPENAASITGRIVNTNADLITVEFWHENYETTISAQFYRANIWPATWQERRDGSRDTVQEHFNALESELRETFVITNSMLPEELHENRASDGQTIAELERRLHGKKAAKKAVDEKQDRAERVELYTQQMANCGQITYRPRVQPTADDLNPDLAELFGVALDQMDDSEAYTEELAEA